jgi:hypothetical protein
MDVMGRILSKLIDDLSDRLRAGERMDHVKNPEMARLYCRS